MIQVEGSRIVVTTRTLLAQFDNGLLVSLKASETARNLLSGDRPAGLCRCNWSSRMVQAWTSGRMPNPPL